MKRWSFVIGVTGVLIGLAAIARADSATIVLASRNASTGHVAPAIGEQEAQRWLSDVQGAWERRDAAALVHLGVVGSANEQRLANVLASYRALHVSLSNVSVSVESGHTLVSYDRTDSDEMGTTLRHPRRTIELHRVASDQIAAVRAHSVQN
jgi:hypothetical protein